jgi:hypothetical protein
MDHISILKLDSVVPRETLKPRTVLETFHVEHVSLVLPQQSPVDVTKGSELAFSN